MSEVLS